jgi:hypothetical protein
MTSGPDVARAAKAAGFPDRELVTAVAVAWAESSFNANAVNRSNKDGSVDYGLWQINTVHGYPELQSGAWRDPKVNAVLAKRVHDKQGWAAWSVYRPSDPVGYARYLAGRAAAVAFVAAGVGPAAAAAGAVTAPADIGKGIGADADEGLGLVAEIAKEPLSALRWLMNPRSWERIAYLFGGMALTLGGAYLLINSTIAKTAAKTIISKGKGAAAAVGEGSS